MSTKRENTVQFNAEISMELASRVRHDVIDAGVRKHEWVAAAFEYYLEERKRQQQESSSSEKEAKIVKAFAKSRKPSSGGGRESRGLKSH